MAMIKSGLLHDNEKGFHSAPRSYQSNASFSSFNIVENGISLNHTNGILSFLTSSTVFSNGSSSSSSIRTERTVSKRTDNSTNDRRRLQKERMQFHTCVWHFPSECTETKPNPTELTSRKLMVLHWTSRHLNRFTLSYQSTSWWKAGR